MCLSCAIPVRGRVLGSECLAEALGPDAPPDEAQVPTGGGRRTIAGLAFAVAVLSTVLPWSRFGEGDSIFGAWSASPRWSLLAAVAAVGGLALWLVTWRRADRPAAEAAALAILGGLVALGALLAVLRPPYATSASFAPWITLAAGLTALVASLSAGRPRVRQPAGST